MQSTPLVDFLRSGRLSNSHLALEHEDWSAAEAAAAAVAGLAVTAGGVHPAAAAAAADTDIRGGQQKHNVIVMENAARIASCLTKSYIGMCNYIANVNVNHHDDPCLPLDILELSDFFINLKQGGHNNDFNNPNSSSFSLAELNIKKVGVKGGGKKEVVHDGQLHQEHTKCTSFHSNNKNNNTNGVLLSGENASSKNNPSDIIASGSIKRWTILGVFMGDSDSSPSSRTPIMVNMAQQQSSLQQQTQHLNNLMLTPMQVLGKLLYQIFSQGREDSGILSIMSLLNLGRKGQDASCIDVVDDSNNMDSGRSLSKSRRASKVTIFSTLIESQKFPISVCRFLSDILNNNNMHHDHQLFASFEEVIQDLESMIAEPATFLHDIGEQHQQHPPQLMFGQRCVGREEEVTKLIGIATKMEEGAGAGVQERSDDQAVTAQEKSMDTINAVFVSGVAGSGKSHLVQTVGTFLSDHMGWLVIRSKFERGMEYASRGVMSIMFDELIVYLLKMKESSNASDVKFSQRASKSMLESLGGREHLSLLIDFLPSLPLLFGGFFNQADGKSVKEVNTNMADWQLIQSLSKILDAVLGLDRFIMIICDDLQWADKTAISIIGEVLINSASMKHTSRRCLFVGLYREEEVSDEHPLSIQYFGLKTSSDINTVDIKISSLSKNDVVGMITTQLRLPRRLVMNLASVVHKKTSGLAIFVVELLNSLFRDSTISYDFQRLRYVWDHDRIGLIQTADGVAGLIASNISSLPIASQQALQVLSCFGTQTDTDLIQILENYQHGILLTLVSLTEAGILDEACGIVIFSHDLIQQSVYESMSLAKRRQLHLDLGNLLGALAIHHSPAHDYTFFAGIAMTSSLVSLACDQVNSVIEYVSRRQGHRYAKWNLAAGKENASQSNFCASLHYHSKGIEFLGEDDDHSSSNCKLSLELYEGAAHASYALGEAGQAIGYAEKVVEKVPLKDTLVVWAVILKSLTMLSKHDECITKGNVILRRLGLDLPLSPTKETIMEALADTERIVSRYSVSEIANLRAMAKGNNAQNIATIMESIYPSCYTVLSPFLPLAVCTIIKCTLENGICELSTVAFAMVGQYKIFLEGDYLGAKKCADIVRAITEKHGLKIQSYFVLHNTIDIYFDTPRELSRKMLKYSQSLMGLGEAHLAMIALGASSRNLIYGGEDLSLISQSMSDRTKMIAKHSKFASKFDFLDNLLMDTLTGSSSASRSQFSIEDLQVEAESTKDKRLLFRIHAFSVMMAYWRGDFLAAEESSNIAVGLYPVSKMPSIHIIYFTFFRGLVLFQRYSEDPTDQRLEDGKEMMNDIGGWAKNSIDVFGNKWFLLQAEYAASMDEKYNDDTEHSYKKSIQAARDHGFIHEQGLALELLGSYYAVHGRDADSTSCVKKAYTCFARWGATAVANKVLHDNGVGIESITGTELEQENSKRYLDTLFT